MTKLFVAGLAALFMCGCASTSSLKNLSIGMGKKEVIHLLGDPVTTHASARHSWGIEIWDYIFREGGHPLRTRERYWIFFREDKVIQWGKEGDWGDLEREPDYIKKVIFENETDKKKESRFK